MSVGVERLVVIGAGPAGLATAGLARRMGVEPLLIDKAATVGGAWAKMRPAMRCLSPRRFDQLPDGSVPTSDDDRARAEDVLRWLRAYGQRESFSFVGRSEVRSLTQHDDELHIEAFRPQVGSQAGAVRKEDQPGYTVRARSVVVATGEFDKPVIPALSGTFNGPAQHTAALQIGDVSAGERVLVVGARNSAAEVVPLLLERGATVTVATRRSLPRAAGVLRGVLADLQFAVSGAAVGPGSWVPCHRQTPPVDDVLRPLHKANKIALVGEVTALRADGAACGEGWVTCDRIVWATGFQRATDFLPPQLLDGDWPVHERGVSTAWPNLGFVGLPCQRTRRSGFLRGLVGDAEAVLEQLL